jgi:hypothetical protein
MTAPHHLPEDPTTRRPTSVLAPVAAGAAALGLCCGLPLLASLGAAGVVVGFGVGSWVAVAAASVVATFGVLRWRRGRSCAVAVETDSNVGSFPVVEREPEPTREVRR